jgi:hypothetical protein
VARQILDELSATVLSVGELLDSVFEGYSQFDQWVEDNLPLQPETANRIRAMYHLHEHRPGHPDLPEPWKALWTLS